MDSPCSRSARMITAVAEPVSMAMAAGTPRRGLALPVLCEALHRQRRPSAEAWKGKDSESRLSREDHRLPLLI